MTLAANHPIQPWETIWRDLGRHATLREHSIHAGSTMARSRYDELHDRFFPILSSKEGTRYERLAAVVLKALDEKNVVIHDFKLRGDSTVRHQIDVLIEVAGVQKRVLIECKDFDKSKKAVGLGILRDFRSVVEDTNANEAFVLTCTGYTKPARKYAKAKNIKLAVMRIFEESDWEGRIKQVVVNLHIQMPPRLERVDLEFATPDQRTAFSDEAAAEGFAFPIIAIDSPVYLLTGTGKVQVVEYLNLEANKIPVPTSPTLHEINLDRAQWQIQVGSNPPHLFQRFTFVFRAFPILTQPLHIGMDRIAELILRGFGDDDIFVFADQLKRAKLDSAGNVTYDSGATPSSGMDADPPIKPGTSKFIR
jgi:hypothetical protein